MWNESYGLALGGFGHTSAVKIEFDWSTIGKEVAGWMVVASE